MIGRSSLGTVYLVQHKASQKLYAMKAINKAKILSKIQADDGSSDQLDILKSFDYPFILKLEFSFQNERNLCMVMEFVNCGELFDLLNKNN